MTLVYNKNIKYKHKNTIYINIYKKVITKQIMRAYARSFLGQNVPRIFVPAYFEKVGFENANRHKLT
jgi:hypothetical protein